MFDDPIVEIQELTSLIKNDITALNVALSDLQTLQNMEMAEGHYSDDRVVHSTTVCDDLKGKLMGATKELKNVLTARTEVFPFTLENCTFYQLLCSFVAHFFNVSVFVCHRISRLMRAENRYFRQMH